MFGHVTANVNALNEEEKHRYRAAYCGLCHCLGERHGLCSRLSLSYDLTFLLLLLSSLYEPEEQLGSGRCIVHPVRRHDWLRNECTDYAADMTIALSYHKALDDWEDDGKLYKKAYSSMLLDSYKKVQARWPEQCALIERELKQLYELEKDIKASQADEAANSFGRLMAELFVYKKDRWEPELRAIGYGLGRYIYLADAAVDFDDDMKSGNYNPLTSVELEPQELRPVLKSFLGDASEAFERLPLVQDVNLLRNILYSGIWMKYNQAIRPETEKTEND